MLNGRIRTIVHVLLQAFILSAVAAQGDLSAAPPSTGTTLRVGVAFTDITPKKFPVSMTGSFWDRMAVGAHDRLYARCMVLDDGRTRVVIVVCDSCLISREIFDRVKDYASKAADIPPSHILMSATHTHTAPTAVALADCVPDSDYVGYLVQRLMVAVVAANSSLIPAKVAWGVGKQPDEVFNRRWKMKAGAIPPNPFGRTDKVRMNPPRGSADLLEPAAPTDPDVTVLSVQTADGKPLALFANYSLHYVGGIPPQQVSADYFGEFARQAATKLGAGKTSPFVAMLSNGTSGDINNYNFRNPRPAAKPFERVRAVAGKVGDTALAAVKDAKYSADISLAMQETEIELAIRKPSADELQQAKELLADVTPDRRLTLPEVYARETVRLHEGPQSIKLKLQALRIGDLAIAAVPCEAFVEIGLEIKKRSPHKPTCIVGLANGYNGYLPTPEQHTLGGYETWRSGWSNLEVEASRKITDELLKLLKDVSR